MSNNPFASTPFGEETEAATEETVTETTETEAETEAEETTDTSPEKKEKKEKKTRGPSNRRKTPEETKFILENYKDMSTREIAEKLGLTKQQVYRTVLDAKKAYLEKAETLPPEKAEKVRAWVDEHLPSKEANRGGGKRGNMVDNIFDDIFGDL